VPRLCGFLCPRLIIADHVFCDRALHCVYFARLLLWKRKGLSCADCYWKPGSHEQRDHGLWSDRHTQPLYFYRSCANLTPTPRSAQHENGSWIEMPRSKPTLTPKARTAWIVTTSYNDSQFVLHLVRRQADFHADETMRCLTMLTSVVPLTARAPTRFGSPLLKPDPPTWYVPVDW